MGLEVVTHLSDLVITNPVGAVDPKSQGDDHIRNIKKALRTDFPNISGVVTATHTELSKLAGVTSSTAELNILTGVTLTAAQINDAARKTVSNLFTQQQVVQLATHAKLVMRADSAGTANASRLEYQDSAGTRQGYVGKPGNGIAFDLVNEMAAGTISIVAPLSVNLTATGITFNGVSLTDLARLSQANVFTANQTITKASSTLSLTSNTASDSALEFKTNSATRGYVIAAGAAGGGVAGSAIGDMVFRAQAGGLLFSCDSGTTLHFGLSSAGLVITPNANPAEVGYKGLPPNTQTANYTAVLADTAKQILCTTNPGFTVTIPANASVAYPIGTALTVTNITGGNISIAITTDSLALAGTGTTGTRTLAHNGVATALKVTSNAWVISGAGIS